ncbi:ATP-binding protein [Pelagicoccus albus]|uniref:histidine kinase n=1 Tax=Pelagicoccus albus TaxID=415222 RepID=A0A7X1B991_9BACT|nr:response regulator [Pelagicoccus albus]
MKILKGDWQKSVVAASVLVSTFVTAVAASDQVSGVPWYSVYEPEMTGAKYEITNLSLDPLGRMVATSGEKLLVYDGEHWISYEPKSEVYDSAPVLYAATRGPDGRFYCSSNLGISRIILSGDYRYELVPIEGAERTEDMHLRYSFVHGPYVYFYEYSDIVRFDPVSGTIVYDAIERHASSQFLPLGEDILEFGTALSVYLNDPEGGSTEIDTSLVNDGRYETRTAAHWNGQIYLGTDAGVSVVKDGVAVPWDCEINELETRSVAAMTPLSDDYLAVSIKSQGVYVLDSKGRVAQLLDRQIDHRFGDIRNLVSVGNHVLWASFGRSVVRLDLLSPLTNYSALIPYATIYPRFFEHRDKLHLVTGGKIVSAQYFEGGALKGYKTLFDQAPEAIVSAVSTEDGIVCTDYDSVYLLGDDGSVQTIAELDEINLVVRPATEEGYLLAAGPTAIYLLEKVSGEWRYSGKSVPSDGQVIFSVELDDGSVWLEQGPGRCLRVVIDEGAIQATHFGTDDGLYPSWVNIWKYGDQICFGAEQMLEVLTWTEEGGFEPFVRDSFPWVKDLNGVTRPGLDTKGNLWVPTNGSQHVILKPDASGTFEVDSTKLSKLEGEIIIKAIPRQNGSVWLIGRNHVYHYDPLRENGDGGKGETVVYQVELVRNNEVIYSLDDKREGKPLDLPFASNKLRFQITTPSIGYVGDVSHEYFLDGVTETWTKVATSGELLLLNLREGNYTLKVRTLFDGVPSESVDKMSFTIRPPWFRKDAAYFGYALGSIVFVLALVHFFRFRSEKKNKLLQVLVQERTEGLRKANERLNDANQQLYEMYEKTKAADQAKSTFLATVSHEMRTPLNSIIGPAELLMETQKGEFQQKFLGLIKAAGLHLLEFIDDVLEFSASESTERPFVYEPVHVKQLLLQISDSMMIKANELGVALNFEFQEDCPMYWNADTKAINQIVTNLLNNAFKFTKEGSITLSAGAEQNDAGQPLLVMSVKDTGIGISKDEQESIFEPFHQVENTFTRQYDGAGLGLAIVKQIVDRMEGAIVCQSELGEGSCFRVALPLVVANEEEEVGYQLRTSAGALELEGKAILLVDDNVPNREVAKGILSRFKCEVVEAENGKSAILLANSRKFDLILIDIRMPVMSGLEASKWIRNEENLNVKTPIVALSAFLSESVKMQCEEAGIDGYLSKPVVPEVLANVIFESLKKAG